MYTYVYIITTDLYFCNIHTNYCKRLRSQSALWTLITLDQFLGGPNDDSRELKHVALK
jgi:hypothetical protein